MEPTPPQQPTPPIEQPQPPVAPQQPTPPPYAPQQPAAPAAYAENPGQTLGIVGIVLDALGISVGGIILGVMSRNKSRAANMSTTLGTVSLIWGIVATVLVVVGFALVVLAAILSSQNTDSKPSNTQNYSTPSSNTTPQVFTN